MRKYRVEHVYGDGTRSVHTIEAASRAEADRLVERLTGRVALRSRAGVVS